MKIALPLLAFAIVSVLNVHAIPVEQAKDVHQKLITKTFEANVTVSDTSFKPLDLIGQFCQGSGDVDQCGSGNCEAWSTGDVSGGPNAGRLYCNDQGLFCSGNSCYYPCMDKSPDTKVLSFNYLPVTSQTPVPEAVFTHYIDNHLNITVSGNYEWQESVQTQYQWSWSTTTSVSMTLESTVGLPDVCSIHDSVTTSVSSTTGQSQTNTDTKSWTAQQDYEVPPQTTVKLTYIVSQTQFTVPYEQTVQFGGTLALWCSNSVNGHHFWMPAAGDALSLSPLCNANICTFSGTFTGIQGVTDKTSYDYCPLGIEC